MHDAGKVRSLPSTRIFPVWNSKRTQAQQGTSIMRHVKSAELWGAYCDPNSTDGMTLAQYRGSEMYRVAHSHVKKNSWYLQHHLICRIEEGKLDHAMNSCTTVKNARLE
jgi:hypothetical protein